MTEYIHIRNWDRFQHADTTKRGRAPIWIKLYTELLSDEQFLSLTEHRRLVLICLWIEYARTRARLPLDTRSLTRRLQLRVTTADIQALVGKDFLDIRSTPARDTLDTRSATGRPNDNETTPTTPPTKTQENNANRQDNDVPTASLEKMREEKKDLSSSTGEVIRPDVPGWSVPGDTLRELLERRNG